MCLLSLTPGRKYVITWVTWRTYFSMHRLAMDKPSWVRTNREKVTKKISKSNRYNEFVTTPVHFNLNFPKNHDFDDWDNAFIKILNVRRSVDPGWYGDAKRYQKRDLESSCSSAMTESVIRVISQGSRLNRHTTLE